MAEADTERALMGVVLGDVPAVLPVAMAAGVRDTWFTADPWPVVWRALESIWKRGAADHADAVAVLEEAQRVNASLSAEERAVALSAEVIGDAVSAADVGSAAELHILNLRDAYLKRRFRAALRQSEKTFARLPAEEAGVEMRRALDDVLADAVADKKISSRAVLDQIMAESETAHEKRIVEKDLSWTPGYKMPWPQLTGLLNGLRPGLHVIAARPSVGKTAFLVNLIRFWCESGVNVSLNSLDMPRREMMRRFVVEKSRVSLAKSLFSPTRTDLSAMQRAMDDIAAWPLALTEIRDVDDFRTYCMIERSAGRLGIVCCDYMQLLHARALGREDAVEYARVSYVSDTLKRLANELDVPVVALCQLNRESAKSDQAGREPGLADLRGSGSIEQDAFTVALLHRDMTVVEGWRKNGAPRGFFPGGLDTPAPVYGADDVDAVWWILCKSQNGATGKYPFVPRKRYFAWMLGDSSAAPIEEQTGHGAAAKITYDNTPKFSRIHSDWRHDPLEAELRRNHVLIEPEPEKRQQNLDFSPPPSPDDEDPFAAADDLEPWDGED